MKVYLSVDLEGVACVTTTKTEENEYAMARRWMTAEANAAIEAALQCGATEVVVADAHGNMLNLLPDELNEEAMLVRGSPRPLTMMDGLDETFDAAFLIGYHSMSGTVRGNMSHTYTGLVYSLRLNGILVGESGFNAAIAGHFRVPVALVCGDDTVDAEVGALLPWTERVITKWAISPWAARSLTPKASQRRIREGAVRALNRLSEMKPFVLETPVRFEVDLAAPAYLELGADIPGVERVGGRTLVYTGPDMPAVTRILRLILNAGQGRSSL
jgi:D-amino peptidase